MRTILLVAALVAGCTVTPAPVAPPPDGPGTCETACSHLAELGGCGIENASCLGDCAAESSAESEIGVHFPTGCLTAAASCQEALRCE